MGSFIKDYISKIKNIPRTDIYHLTVMPCFDKKLEASRDQFFDVDTQTKDVDCVITSSMYECNKLLQILNNYYVFHFKF